MTKSRRKTYGITGVSNGIGAALAARLKAAGHKIVGYDLVAPAVPVDHFIALDLADMDALHAAAADTPEPLDGLCNNAGIPPRDGLEAEILQVNFTGTRAYTEAMLPHLKPGASVINMASRAGHRWHENLAQVKALAAVTHTEDLAAFVREHSIDPTRAYNLSKEAVLLWTFALAEPLMAMGVRVNSVSPGGVDTGILADFQRAFGDRMTRNVARAGRVGRPEEIAAVAAFVLSDESHWLKGVDIPVDGGMGAFNMSDTLGLSAMRVASDDKAPR
ncbi:coniferyl-alcohol dehydrogenase [Roseobacteraceae bacterium S113]